MLTNFVHVGTLWSGAIPYLESVSGLAVAMMGSQPVLYSVSVADGGMCVFSIGSNVATLAQPLASLGYTAAGGTMGAVGLSVARLSGQTVLVPVGRYDDALALHRLDAGGGFGTVVSPWSGAPKGAFDVAITVDHAGKCFVLGAQAGVPGFASYAMAGTLALTEAGRVVDTATSYAADVAALTAVQAYGKTFVVAASVVEDGLTAYYLRTSGGMTTYGSIGAADGVGIDAPCALQSVVVAGQAYVLAGSAGSGTLSVFSLATTGIMTLTDHVLDDLGTRFDAVTVLEAFSVSGRSFVLAGGADGGISCFEVLPGGRLFERGSVIDTADMALDHVAAIETLVRGTSVTIFVSSGTEAGITQLSLDLAGIAPIIQGTRLAEVITAGSGNDLIAAGSGNDTVYGSAGSDIIMDGTGADVLWGGSGADVFVLASDASSDTVRDFQRATDVIDLSAWAMLYSLESLDIRTKSYGAAILFRDHWLGIYTADGSSLTAVDFSDADFLF